jgi:hypothetical protein
MDQEISKIESYSKAFAEKTVISYFNSNEVIRGQEILSFTGIEQVNLFIVKNLFVRWKEELNQVKSPYFDYENREVQDALIQFMNTVSKHIAIRKEFFKPLVEKATYQALLLILKPSYYFKTEFPIQVSILQLQELQKYFKIHKSFIESLPGKVNGTISREEISKIFENEIGGTNTSEKQDYIAKFSSVLIFESLQPASVSEQKLESTKTDSFVEAKGEELPVKENILKESPKVVESIRGNQAATTTINEKFTATQLTLNDILRQNELKTIADQISKSKIENIRSAISLNQKFQFVNNLFKGIPSDYESALDDVDRCSNFEDAMNILDRNYASRFHWDYNNIEVREFIQIVERKFS